MMNRSSHISSQLKKVHRKLNAGLIKSLEEKGFLDLRPSFLEVLLFISENPSPSIKEIGQACGLKKQTMTSHLNELEKRGYIARRTSSQDKRVQEVFLTDYGQRFKSSLGLATQEQEEWLQERVGDVEIDRLMHIVENVYGRLQ